MGRQIVWKYYDDGYNPANTVQLTRRLVEQDKVFATVGGLGTEPQLSRSLVPEPAEGAAGARLDGASTGVRLAVARSTRGRSAGSPTTSPRAGCTACTPRRTTRARRSGSSTRTTTTARTTCTGSAPRLARSTRTRTSSPRRRSRRPRPALAAQITRIKAAVRRSSPSSSCRRRQSARSQRPRHWASTSTRST